MLDVVKGTPQNEPLEVEVFLLQVGEDVSETEVANAVTAIPKKPRKALLQIKVFQANSARKNHYLNSKFKRS